MALVTSAAELSTVCVIVPVAADAVSACIECPCAGVSMAVITCEFFMCTTELEAGGLVMVEYPGVPRIRVMAGAAACAQPALMCVVLLVTAMTGRIGLTVLATEVALFTLGGRMHADQREQGEVMVEAFAALPPLRAMAFITPFSQLALMDVVCLVAGKTVCCQLFMLDITAMAIITGYILVPAG